MSSPKPKQTSNFFDEFFESFTSLNILCKTQRQNYFFHATFHHPTSQTLLKSRFHSNQINISLTNYSVIFRNPRTILELYRIMYRNPVNFVNFAHTGPIFKCDLNLNHRHFPTNLRNLEHTENKTILYNKSDAEEMLRGLSYKSVYLPITEPIPR